MADRLRFRPFTGDTEKKIRLKNAPLALVLCQIRWPEFQHLRGDLSETAQAFGSVLEEYPVISNLHEVAYTLTPEGVSQQPGDKIFQWHSIDGVWHISLSRRFVTMYCTTYTSFPEFLERLELVLEAVRAQVKVPLVERVGVRYVNQVTDSRLVENLGEYVRPEVLGYSGLVGMSDDVRLASSANQARYVVDDAALQVRSGIVPPGETVDPAVSPAQVPSWVLDLDASSERVAPFDPSNVLSTAGRLSDFAYDFFKHVSTEGFLREFGDAE
ncbi:TIGR04255 family protein [Cellulosimicrobium sp. ES-005]|uniref:TIGR04255 family protein n=1 Tax=Cellulosimicrobium sp. ES-005 TaxID=3163031 RepID=A0AAU8FVA9_9MICO